MWISAPTPVMTSTITIESGSSCSAALILRSLTGIHRNSVSTYGCAMSTDRIAAKIATARPKAMTSTPGPIRLTSPAYL